VPPKTIVATALTFAINFTASTKSLYAQVVSHEAQQTSTSDPSELAPGPSTWKGALTDSLRLLLVEHSTTVVFQGKTRRARRTADIVPLYACLFLAACRSARTPAPMASDPLKIELSGIRPPSR
jgi:hypothetical protein